MLKRLFGFGADKRAAFDQAVAENLKRYFNIELDVSAPLPRGHPEPKIGSYTGYVAMSAEYFYQRLTPEHCALGIALNYFHGLSSSDDPEEKIRSKELAPQLMTAAKAFELEGSISSELRENAEQVVEDLA